MTNIDPRIHQALDDGTPADGLEPPLRREVERLERAVALLVGAPVAASVAARVMGAIRRPAPTRVGRVMRWLLTPRAVVLRLRPVLSLALAAAVLLLVVLPLREPVLVLGSEEGIAQFVARFPGARSVAVVGSFNDWSPAAMPLEDPDHDGVWESVVVLPAGTHEYMFVVDGERWIPDPLAGRFVRDDFGRENSLLIVRPSRL